MKTLLSSLLISLLFLPSAGLAEDKASAEDRVIVTVNGVPITAMQIQYFLSRQNNQLSAEDAVRELINVELVNQAARDEKMLDDPIVQMEIHRLTTSTVASAYLQRRLASLEITDEQVDARYQADYGNGGETSEYNASHILVETEDEAKDIIKQLDAGGDFAELAKSLSTGPSGKNGGDLGWFKKEDMVQPFSNATMQLEKGKHSDDPVQTQFGWHVIKLNDLRKSEPPALDSVRQAITQSIAADTIKSKLKKLHDAATIEFAEQQ